MQSHNQLTHDAVIHAARSGKKEELRLLLKTKTIAEETLYQVVKQMIPKNKKSLLDWEIIQLVVNDPRFNPNYHNESRLSARRVSRENIFCFSLDNHLVKIAITHECHPSLTLLLNHPRIDFEKLRNLDFFKFAINKNIFKTVNQLLRSPVFFTLEKDWLDWADKHCPTFKIVFALNFCWHNWSKHAPGLFDLGLCNDAINEVSKNLFHVSLFAKKESELAPIEHPPFKCGHALC